MRLVLGALALRIATVLLNGCGTGSISGAASSGAQQESHAISSAAAQAKSATAPGTSQPVTETPATKTGVGIGGTAVHDQDADRDQDADHNRNRNRTSRHADRDEVRDPAASVSVNNSTSVEVQATQHTPAAFNFGARRSPMVGLGPDRCGCVAVVATALPLATAAERPRAPRTYKTHTPPDRHPHQAHHLCQPRPATGCGLRTKTTAGPLR